MNLSMKWLREFVSVEDTPRGFAEAMTLSGSKVEGYAAEGAEITGVVVGRVLSVTPHTNSDHLVVCSIDVGQDAPLQIVTGASNVVPGALVPVATDGATLPGGKTIKTGELRGVLSQGMLCSLGELGLTGHDFPYAIEDGIFLIEEDCAVGEDIHSAIGLNDLCVEFEITPNRPDCLSVIGLAREAAATYRLPLNLHTPEVKGCGGALEEALSVTVENPVLCPRYTARMVKNVRIAPSPRWMRERLRASGVRPINNLVDITNYVMLEYGQPLHAFDARLIPDGHIVVRNARPGEVLETLDGVERKLTEKMLVIADREKPAAVAGVMGGKFSGISEDTTTVIFESANFMGSSIRTTARDLGMRTDASARFEKGLDPENTLAAVARACELVELLGAGDVVDGVIDVRAAQPVVKTIRLEHEWINSFLGLSLSREEMVSILEQVCFEVNGDLITVPSYRSDVEHKADIAEEIARFYGYDKIPVTAIRGVAVGKRTPAQQLEAAVHSTLQSCGCYELATYSFISPKYYDKIRLPKDHPLRNSVVITNPLGEDTSVMRTTILPSMLEVLSRNYNNRNAAFYGYEIGNEYVPNGLDELPDENPQVCVGLYGNDCDFFTLKGMLEAVLSTMRVRDWDIEGCTDHPTFHPGRCAKISKDGVMLGYLGEVHPLVLEQYSIGTRAYVGQLDFKKMLALSGEEARYRPLPKFPALTRDLSLLCPDELPVLSMERAVRSAVGKQLEKIVLFDVYRGAQIAADCKSVSFSLTLRSDTGTLTDVEADAAVTRALEALEKLGATLRA